MRRKSLICLLLCLIMTTSTLTTIVTSDSNLETNENYFDEVENAYPAMFFPLLSEVPGHFEPFFDVEMVDSGKKSCYGVDCADFNNDGHLDFAINSNDLCDESEENWYAIIEICYWSEGEYIAEIVREFLYDEGYGDISDIEVADFDDDGDVDILYAYSEREGYHRTNGTGYICFNDGSNNFPIEEQVFWHSISTGKRYNPKVESADFDDDGDVDFIVGDNSGKVAFYINDGLADFTLCCEIDYPEYTDPQGISWGITSGDFDDDEDIDFIVTQEDGYEDGDVIFHRNDGSSTCFNHSEYSSIVSLPCYRNESFYVTGFPVAHASLCSLDYNNDGLMDFLMGVNGGMYMYIQRAGEVFEHHTVARLPMYPYPDGEPLSYTPGSLHCGGLATGDMDGDGDTDAVVADLSHGEVRIFSNDQMMVDIIHPDRCRIFVNDYIAPFFSGIPIIPNYFLLKHSSSIVIGAPTVEVLELEPLSRVEFYLGNRLVHTDTEAPYEWEWDNFGFGRYRLKAVGYDLEGNNVGYDDSVVWKFFSRVPF